MNNPYASVALIAVLVLLFYFFVMRPQKRRQQQQQRTLNTIEPGTRVMMTSGIFATVISVGEKQMVVEPSPGVRLTILKQAMSKIVPAGDEDDPATLSGDDYDSVEASDDAGIPASSEPVWPPTTGQPAPAAPVDMWAAGTETADRAAASDEPNQSGSATSRPDGQSSTQSTQPSTQSSSLFNKE